MNVKNKTLSVSELLSNTKEVLDSIPPEPLGVWMKEKGFDPEEGFQLMLPDSYREIAGNFLPHYVSFSKYCNDPYLFLAPSRNNFFNVKDLYENTRAVKL